MAAFAIDAMKRGNHKKLLRCIQYSGSDKQMMSKALSYASNSDNYAAAELLIKTGAIVNWRDPSEQHRTPLHNVQSVEMLKLLLKHGANIEAEDREGLRPIFCSVACGVPDVVRYFINAGANVHLPASRNSYLERTWSVVHIACEVLEPACLAVLLEAGCPPNVLTSNDRTPFDVLLRTRTQQGSPTGVREEDDQRRKLECVKLLYKYGGCWTDNPIETLLSQACYFHYPKKIVKLLIKYGASPNVRPIIWYNHTSDVTCEGFVHILRCGAEPNTYNEAMRNLENFLLGRTPCRPAICYLTILRDADVYIHSALYNLLNLPLGTSQDDVKKACKAWIAAASRTPDGSRPQWLLFRKAKLP